MSRPPSYQPSTPLLALLLGLDFVVTRFLLEIAGWFAGVAMLMFGLLWVQDDAAFAPFDAACAALGMSALPPVANRLRRALGWNFGARTHAFSGAFVLLVAGVVCAGRAEERHFVHIGALSGGPPTPIGGNTLDQQLQKAFYVSAVKQQVRALDAQSRPAAWQGRLGTLQTPRMLLQQSGEYALSVRERLAIAELQAKVDAERAAVVAKARGAYVADINRRLAPMKIVAVLSRGALVFTGAKLDDPRRQAALADITRARRNALGLNAVRFFNTPSAGSTEGRAPEPQAAALTEARAF